MRKVLLSLTLIMLMAVGNMQADDISAEQALQIARQFCENTPSLSRGLTHVSSYQQLKMAYQSVSKTDASTADWYAFDCGEDDGFVVVSGNDGTPQNYIKSILEQYKL